VFDAIDDEVDSESVNGTNYVSFVKVTASADDNEDPDDTFVYKTYSIVTVNLGGAQMNQELWNVIGSYLQARCPLSLYEKSDDQFTKTCKCPSALNSNGVHEMP
jgi:hypothetical protein